MEEPKDGGGCSGTTIIIFILIFILIDLCDRVDTLEHKNDKNVTIEIPK
jgi:hypothetical protein